MSSRRVGYLGPPGSFSHEALLNVGDVEPVAVATIGDLLFQVANGELDEALAPLENAIEGTVSATIDGLVFDHDLVIQREIVLPISLHLLARPGVRRDQLLEVRSYSHALAQVRDYLARHALSSSETTSTSRAAAEVAASSDPLAAVGSRLAAELFHLDIIDSNIEDHRDNETRFVLVARDTIAAPSGADRTTIVCFQDADHPGSLYAILGRFAARDLNLTKLESRPTKKGLGDYCFVIECEGHIADDIVADCLADLQAHLTRVKFLGSYPVDGEGATRRREEVHAARRAADEWMEDLRRRVRDPA